MSNCISFIGNSVTESQLQSWATTDDMQDVLATKLLQNVCVANNKLLADEFECPDLKCRDICAIVLHTHADTSNEILLIQAPALGIYDTETGISGCLEGFCLTSEEPECCDANDLVDICGMMHDPCKRHSYLYGIYLQFLSGKAIASASTPAGRSVTFSKVSIDCIKDELLKAEVECNICNPCRRNDRCFTYRW